MTDLEIAAKIRSNIEDELLPVRDVEFAQSLLTGFTRYQSFTERQRPHAVRLATLQARPAPVATATVNAGGMTRIMTMFTTAQSSGLRRPTIRLNRDGVTIRLTPAPAAGRNAGAIYVQRGDRTYIGKIVSGGFFPVREAGDTTREAALLASLANDPEQVARVHGHATGACCFCSRDLTDARSVGVGYGPICAENFGLAWGAIRADQYRDVRQLAAA